MKFAFVATILAVFANMKVSVASETESGGPGARPATDLVLVQIERAKQYGVVSQNTESLPTFGQDLQVLKSISKSLRGGVTSDHGDSGDDNGDITFEFLHNVNVPDSVPDDVDHHQDGALDVDRATGELTVKDSEGLLGDQTYRSSQYQRYLQMMKQGQTEAPARKLERTSAPERTVAPARKVWQRPANTK